jgi:hypothetical protein
VIVKRAILLVICAVAISLAYQDSLEAVTFTVTDTTDSGPGSLRDAIFWANSTKPTADTILFNIPYAGIQRIFLRSQLPALTDTAGVFIDGLSQPGTGAGSQPPSTANILIQVEGSFAGPAYGFLITSPNNTIRGLSVTAFEQSAIRIEGTPYPTRNNLIYCNFVGMDPTGMSSRGNGWNQLGPWSGVEIVAPTAADFADRNTVRANLISSNYANGISIGGNCQAYWNFVEDNYIGTDVTGMSNFGNTRSGVVLDDGAHINTIASNLIVWNGTDGISLIGNSTTVPPHYTEYNIIHDNVIGIAPDMVTPTPNGMAGINVGGYSNLFFECHARNNTIGPNNTIAHNAWEGIRVLEHWKDTTNGDGNRITRNSIYENGLLGIDLNIDGVTHNDPGDTVDTGPNQELNFPFIVLAYDSCGQTTVKGWIDIDSNPRLAAVEVFKARLDPSGYGEGEVYLGSAYPDSTGNWQITVTGVAGGDSLTATTIDVNDNTSEFSLCEEVLTVGAGVDRDAARAAELRAMVGPNPSTGAVTIGYSTPVAGRVSIRVYDVSGRLVRNLIDGYKPKGEYQVIWDGKDDLSRQPASGIYLIRLDCAGSSAATKLALIK